MFFSSSRKTFRKKYFSNKNRKSEFEIWKFPGFFLKSVFKNFDFLMFLKKCFSIPNRQLGPGEQSELCCVPRYLRPCRRAREVVARCARCCGSSYTSVGTVESFSATCMTRNQVEAVTRRQIPSRSLLRTLITPWWALQTELGVLGILEQSELIFRFFAL